MSNEEKNLYFLRFDVNDVIIITDMLLEKFQIETNISEIQLLL